MQHIRNVSSLGDLEVPLLDGRVVKAGETVEVTDEQGALLAQQPDVWQLVKKAAPRSQKGDSE